MIVAIYVDNISMMQLIYPVTRVNRITPQKRDTRGFKEQENTFSSLLATKLKEEARREDGEGFDAHA